VPVKYIPTKTQAKGYAIISKDSESKLESIFKARVVLNIGTGVEMRSEKMALNFAPIYIEKEDPEIADVKLRCGKERGHPYHIDIFIIMYY
jgi:hypothetical protein